MKRKKQKVVADNTHHGLFANGSDNSKDKKEGETLLARGLQTMLRLTSANHFHLSEMADRKANILISVNSIIIGVILSLMIDKLSDAPYSYDSRNHFPCIMSYNHYYRHIINAAKNYRGHF